MRGNCLMFRAGKCWLKSNVFEEIQVLIRHKCFGQSFTKGIEQNKSKICFKLIDKFQCCKDIDKRICFPRMLLMAGGLYSWVFALGHLFHFCCFQQNCSCESGLFTCLGVIGLTQTLQSETQILIQLTAHRSVDLKIHKSIKVFYTMQKIF